MNTTLKAVCRIEKATGRACIVYRNDFKYGRNSNGLTFYTREEMHCDGSLGYYRTGTRPARGEAEEVQCIALINHYRTHCAKYGDEELRIVKRLTHGVAV